jgi:hypothetical protein
LANHTQKKKQDIRTKKGKGHNTMKEKDINTSLDSKHFSLRKPSERTKSSQEKDGNTAKGIKHITK